MRQWERTFAQATELNAVAAGLAVGALGALIGRSSCIAIWVVAVIILARAEVLRRRHWIEHVRDFASRGRSYDDGDG